MRFVTSLALVLTLATGAPVFAADAAQTKQPTAQQQRTGDCAKRAHAQGLKGSEYKSFMSTCMKGDGSASAGSAAPASNKPATGPATTPSTTTSAARKPTSQQDKMKACNADASSQGLKGDERKKFMSSCLKGASNATAH
jgi:hypothetical protein